MTANGHNSSENEPKENRTIAALDAALESTNNSRVRELIRRAQQRELVETEVVGE